jgi:Transposase IS66 family
MWMRRKVSIRGATAYIWVFTNLHDVVYLYKESREGAFLQEMLGDFKGILVSDFFAAYDALNCDQQKCLIHLMRELNDDVLKHPYDVELKIIVREFAVLLKSIVDTVDRRGLKKRFLGKHQLDVERFYRKIAKLDCKSEEAIKSRNRFVKNRNKLFTFLSHDGVPWHNNNAEHAIRAFSRLRDITRGSFTERSVKNDMILLSICQTCKYSNLDFFEFLRSGENDIYAFAESVRGRRRTRRQQAGLSQ